MEVVANSFLPGDPHLVDKIVYELKAQGIFDQFRKECFADVDTKPAYQNLRQRVEGSVAGFLKEQSWRPDMNKNQVREMLRKTITESGYLETGVERIVDQVVNPKINTIFLPKVEEVVYSYLGIQKPNKNEPIKSEIDLLPNDLEAVSPESDHDKKEDKSETVQDMDESKTEDESPPFEPLEEQSSYIPQEENSIDSHLSGFSVSHESNQSNENKITPMEQDSQMSRNSSDSRLSIVTSDENSKMEVCEETQSKNAKTETNNKHESEKNKHKSSDRHKSRSESKSDRDRKSSKDSRSRHSSSSKDKDKSRDRKDSKSSKQNKEKSKEKIDRDKSKSSSTNKHNSHSNSSKDKKDSSKSDKDKKSSNHKDSKPKDKSNDSKTKEKSSSDKHKHSSSSHSDKHKKDKEKKKEKSKDDHYSSREKKNDRRSTDRDSNDGQSSKQNASHNSESNSSQSQKSSQESSGGGDSNNSNHSEHTTKAPVIVTETVEASELTIPAPELQKFKLFKPKCASNMQEALRLRKIRKQLAKLEKKNQLSLTSVNLDSPILLKASINLDDFHETVGKDVSQNTVVSKDNWDAMEAKLRAEISSQFKEKDMSEIDNDIENCKYFENVNIKKIEFLSFVEEFIEDVDNNENLKKTKILKRKIDDTDTKNNNKRMKLTKKSKDRINNHSDLPVNEKFPLPLSPAESDKSIEKKEEGTTIPLKVKRNSLNKMNSQRYSSDDLYKPRPTFASSRRRGAKNLDN